MNNNVASNQTYLSLKKLPAVLPILLVLVGFVMAFQAHAILCSEAMNSARNGTKSNSFEDQILAVHLTDYFPTEGFIRSQRINRGDFMPTLHFTLGEPVVDHAFGSWSKKRFAIVLPLREMTDQVVNVLAQDTFILGDLKLPANAVVFIPSDESVPNNLPFKIIRYRPGTSVKVAVNDYIAQSGTPILNATGAFARDPISINGVEVERSDELRPYFANLFSTHPYLSMNTHDLTIWGNIDGLFLQTITKWFSSGKPLTKISSPDLQLVVFSIHNSMNQIAKTVSQMKLPPDAFESYQAHMRNLKQNLNLLEIEILIRKKYSKSILETDVTANKSLQSEILNSTADRTQFLAVVERHLNQLVSITEETIFVSAGTLTFTMDNLNLAFFKRRLTQLFPNPSVDQIRQSNLAIIWKVSRLLMQNRISAKEALAEALPLLDTLRPNDVKFNVTDSIMKSLIVRMDYPINDQLILYFLNPKIRDAYGSLAAEGGYAETDKGRELTKQLFSN